MLLGWVLGSRLMSRMVMGWRITGTKSTPGLSLPSSSLPGRHRDTTALSFFSSHNFLQMHLQLGLRITISITYICLGKPRLPVEQCTSHFFIPGMGGNGEWLCLSLVVTHLSLDSCKASHFVFNLIVIRVLQSMRTFIYRTPG